ncbi:MAG: bifunctional UDP-N-acetylglucosamine diphosphorylase/glucosamine-1-phosphate N-acetyltransferase GlmU [Gammaproteobacteria bacterium]
MSLSVVILAAGNGKRMQTKHPKVLHQLAGLSFLERVIRTASRLEAKIFVVYGHHGEQVRSYLESAPVKWVYQKERLGTGHAVLQALPEIPDDDQVLVLVGDSPLVSLETIQNLLNEVDENGVGLVITKIADPTGFGRVIRDQTGRVFSIVEDKDATPEQKKIQDINSGIITAPAKKLKAWLPKLKTNNKQSEYYLPDIIALAVSEGFQVKSVVAQSSEEVLGINDRVQQSKLERYYQADIAHALMLQGVTIIDPTRIDIRGDVNISQDVTIDVNVILEGRVSIGCDSVIGAGCIIKDSSIGENVTILPYSVIEGAEIQSNCSVGPFARIRPKTILNEHAKVGNFVEMKNTVLGAESKANHLSYLGDATIGNRVNIGAGTITCNYDGVHKHATVIKDGVFIGSDTQLVAPVTIGENAFIGAGSTITENAPANELTLCRAKQITIQGWQRPTDQDE